MNRILIRPEELNGDLVSLEDRRAEHVISVLKPSAGDSLRVGLVDGPCGTGRVEALASDSVVLHCAFDEAMPPVPRVSLLLALPRPKVIRRLWAQLAALGVEHIILVNASKVERNYFDTHWLLEENYRPLLLEGLEQAGDTRVPAVRVERRLKPFIEDALDALCPAGVRLVAQPGSPSPLSVSGLGDGRVLLAVGPEGGWTGYELDLLGAHGFTCVGLGERTLRSDTACVALLTMAHELTRGRNQASVIE